MALTLSARAPLAALQSLSSWFSLLLRADARVSQVKVCDFGLARKKPENMMTVDRELYVPCEKSGCPPKSPALNLTRWD